MVSSYKIIREENGKVIKGKALTAFIHNGGTYYLTDIIVFEDAMVECWGLEALEGFKKAVARGWVVTTIPEGANVRVSLLADFTAKKVDCWVNEDDLIKEVEDEIKRLNGEKTSDAICREIYDRFMVDPTEELKEALKNAYEAIPEHKRRFVLGDMDVKDIPIRMIIYGQQELENWSHRLVAKSIGIEPLPSINVPEVKKKT